jgi:hypothetical protein
LYIGTISYDGKVKYKHDQNYLMGDTLGTARAIEAGLRHIYQFLAGETYDKESGKNHLGHAACEVLMALEIFLSRPDRDTRFYTTPWDYEEATKRHFPTPPKVSAALKNFTPDDGDESKSRGATFVGTIVL